MNVEDVKHVKHVKHVDHTDDTRHCNVQDSDSDSSSSFYDEDRRIDVMDTLVSQNEEDDVVYVASMPPGISKTNSQDWIQTRGKRRRGGGCFDTWKKLTVCMCFTLILVMVGLQQIYIERFKTLYSFPMCELENPKIEHSETTEMCCLQKHVDAQQNVCWSFVTCNNNFINVTESRDSEMGVNGSLEF
jgi:hypothetical protein